MLAGGTEASIGVSLGIRAGRAGYELVSAAISGSREGDETVLNCGSAVAGNAAVQSGTPADSCGQRRKRGRRAIYR